MIRLSKWSGGMFVCCCLLIFSSCKPKLNLQQARLQPKEAQLLYQSLVATKKNTQWVNAKADATMLLQGKSNSFNLNIRNKPDSLLWVSINPALGIEVARAIISADSVAFINKLSKEYYQGDINYIESKFNIQNISLPFIQQILFGQAIMLDADEKYRAEIENSQYILKNTPSRRLRRRMGILRNTNFTMDNDSIESIPEDIDDKVIKAIKKENDRYVKRYFLNEQFVLVRQSITDVESKHVIDIQYSEFQELEGQQYPSKVKMIASGLNEKITFDLSFNRLRLESHQSTPFKIPSSYSPVQP